eukprot:UN06360
MIDSTNAAVPVNSFILSPARPIRKSELREEMRVEWAAAYNAHFTMFNFMNFTFVSLIPQKKDSIIKHSSIPVINYCYNINLIRQLVSLINKPN